MSTPISSVPDASLIEASIAVLEPLFGVEDPEKAASRILALCNDEGQRAELERLAREASDHVGPELTALLRVVLIPAGEERLGDPGPIRAALAAAGQKQMVLTPEHWHLALLAAVGCVLVLRNTKKSERKRIKVEETREGHRKITVDEQVEYFNPLGPLGKLLDSFLGSGNSPQPPGED